MHGRNADEQRFSPLDQINVHNVDTLGLAWSFDDFVVRGRTHRGAQATPIMVNGTLYVTGPWSVVYALDARTGAEKWRHDPQVPGQTTRFACCDAVNRGVAYLDGRIFVATLDGRLIALDAKTGKVAWRADTIADKARSYTITGAPRVAGGLIVIGNGGAELGVRGYVSAYNARTGKLAWRFWTIPGQGADESPDVAEARKTWSASTRWDLGGGGTVWDSMTYDPALGLLYIGVGNGGPWPAWQRNAEGKVEDNLYLSSIVAVDAKTGRKRWHYQTTPGDSWDFTATQNMILAELEIGGKPRKVLMQAPKNGFFYVLDRKTGTLLRADKYTPVTWADGVDLKTGRPRIRPEALYRDRPAIVWPSTAGGHNWQPMAFSPQSGLVYIPSHEMPMRFQDQPAPYVPGANNPGASAAPPFADAAAVQAETGEKMRQQGVLKAWDPRTGKMVWQSAPQTWWSGGVLATAGRLVFQGTQDGLFTAYHADTGKILKQIDLGIAVVAAPITYSIDGVQYVAILAGNGGAANSVPFGPKHAGRGYQNRERLFVFKLDGHPVPLPDPRPAEEVQPLATGLATDAATLGRGRKLYATHCARCHAPGGMMNGYPNLWNMPPNIHEAFEQIVLQGAFADAGMPAFGDVLKPVDAQAIRSFIGTDARNRRAGKAGAQAGTAGPH